MNTRSSNSVGAYLLIGLGALFLAGQVFGFDIGRVFDLSWPLFIIIPGVIFLLIAIMGHQGTVGFAVPGAIITGTGAILWFQETFNRWETWAYVWTLYPVFLGAALLFMGTRMNSQEQIKTGRGFIQWGLIAFVALAALFELLIFHDNSQIGRWLVPGLLILGGVYLLYFRRPSEALFSEKDKRG
jgi:hypothetical protein